MKPLISGIITVGEFISNDKFDVWYVDDDDKDKPQKYEMRENRKYIIPGYQRELQWGISNIQTLIDDVEKNSKFLGNIFISTSDKCEFHIMDGQQRLTAILMILERISQLKGEHNKKRVYFENRTYKYFMKALEKDFRFDEIDGYVGSDYLKQENTFLMLWETVKSNVDILDSRSLYDLEKFIMGCDINLIIASYNKKKQEDRELCVDYFIDINNKAEKLRPADILKAYAFKESFEEASESWENIQKESFELGINYPKESMFLHYMLCTINTAIGNKVKKISDEYKLLDSIKVNGKEYSKGTDVELLIEQPNYYKNMFSTVKAFQMFCKTIINDKTSPSNAFIEQLQLPEEYKSKCDYDTIVCMFIIFSDIIKSTDVVPKLLLMKYYIEVITNPTAKEDDYRLLFNINLLATCFSAGSGNKKQTTVFAPIVLSDNWKKKLEDSAIKTASSFGKQVKVNKMILENGKSTEKSGQYLAQRISGIIYSYELKNSKIKINQTRFKEFRTVTNFNDEHFFIHQKNKVIAKYKNNDIIVEYPSKCWKKVSFLCNYLRLDKEVNRKIGNYFILKKIDMIDQELRNNVKVFADEKSKMIFREAKRIFMESECPTEKAINDCDTLEEAKNMLNKYYSNSFEKDYMKLAKIIELPQTL